VQSFRPRIKGSCLNERCGVLSQRVLSGLAPKCAKATKLGASLNGEEPLHPVGWRET
jgi:hypothetical protein